MTSLRFATQILLLSALCLASHIISLPSMFFDLIQLLMPVASCPFPSHSSCANSRVTRLLLLLVVPETAPNLQSVRKLDLSPCSDQKDLSDFDIPNSGSISVDRLGDSTRGGIDVGNDDNGGSIQSLDRR
jgi:hypothetical protein